MQTDTTVQTVPGGADHQAASHGIGPSAVLVPMLNLGLAEDMLQIAATVAAGPSPPPDHAPYHLEPRVVVLGVVEVPPTQPLSTGLDMARSYRALLDFLPLQVEAGGGRVRVDHLVKVARNVSSAVRDAVADERADFALFYWKGYAREPKKHTYGRTLDAILKDPPCNVLLVRPEGWREARRAFVAVRGGPSAELALDLALVLSRNLGIPLNVLHNVSPRGTQATQAAEEHHLLGEEPYAVFSEYFQAAKARSSVPITLVETGSDDPAQALLARADHNDLVVMGMAALTPSERVSSSRNELETQNHALEPFATLKGELREGSKLKTQHSDPPLPLVISNKKGPPLVVLRPAEPLDLVGYVRKGRARHARKRPDMPYERWFVENTYHADEFKDPAEIVRAKQASGLTISVALLTSNDSKHIYSALTGLKRVLVEMHPVADQIAVIDAGSTDGTADSARSLGAEVYDASEILPSMGRLHGRGESWWKSLAVLKGDILVWLDIRAPRFHPTTALSLAGPLLKVPSLHLVKAFGPPHANGEGVKHKEAGAEKNGLAAFDVNWGGSMMPKREASGLTKQIRVRALRPADLEALNANQIAALPPHAFLQALYPPLAGVMAPFGRDLAGRRSTLLSVPALTGENLEAGLLLSVAAEYGMRAIAQVELQHARPAPAPQPSLRHAIDTFQMLARRLRDPGMRQYAVQIAEKLQREVEGKSPGSASAVEVRALGPVERPPMSSLLSGE